MSAIGDARKAFQQVFTLQLRMEQVEASNRKVAQDNKEPADGLLDLDRRLARVEGFIEGAAATAPRRARLPRA